MRENSIVETYTAVGQQGPEARREGDPEVDDKGTNQLFQILQLAVRFHKQSFLVLASPQCDQCTVLVTRSQLLPGDFLFTVQYPLNLRRRNGE